MNLSWELAGKNGIILLTQSDAEQGSPGKWGAFQNCKQLY